ncbi:hypothetical protein [Phenylobacterium sp.]|uniref:hypothetical protein n=1 Tax=Phenylobacterium sp. TaxID=1871053 RepID=UPI002D01628B|nr:hypothetical protein [Phenylobacterium sp.]HLZ74236.1 hypothetical protein [Phenylobacterium sp.]
MTRHFPDDAAVARLGFGLIDRSLPKAEWTHAGHFAAALWLLRHEPEAVVRRRMPPMIRAYNEATGVANTDDGGYHETITLASIAAARAFLEARASLPLHEVVDALMASRLGRPDWLLAFWSKDRLFSVEARRSWIEPDLAVFDPAQAA